MIWLILACWLSAVILFTAAWSALCRINRNLDAQIRRDIQEEP